MQRAEALLIRARTRLLHRAEALTIRVGRLPCALTFMLVLKHGEFVLQHNPDLLHSIRAEARLCECLR